jgi:hypothetical protein
MTTTTQARRKAQSAHCTLSNDARGLVIAQAQMKTIKANVNKATAKAEKAKASDLSWYEGKLGYRLFKGVDLAAYQAQGQHTICSLRAVRTSASKQAQKGETIALFKSAKGFATIRGKLLKAVDGKSDAIQAGMFILSLATKGFIRLFNSEREFLAFIAKEGNAVKLNGKQGKWLEGEHYSFANIGGKLVRHEFDTCSRGKAFFGKVG